MEEEMEERYVGAIPGRRLYFDLEECASKKHCCSLMDSHTNSTHGIILYRPYFREYGVKVCDNIIQQIKNCPWCGIQLPEDLSTCFFDTIKDELGVDVGLSEIKSLPSEFQSEEWWEKRGF